MLLLHEQDRGRWDRLLIHRGLTALARAEALGRPVGGYTVQAAIAACHARATRPDDTDWPRIAGLYDLLAESGDNPVVQLNRAVAHGRAYGADTGLQILAEVADDPGLARTAQVAAVRADLLLQAGRHQEAAVEFESAAQLTGNEAEAALMRRRAEHARAEGNQQTAAAAPLAQAHPVHSRVDEACSRSPSGHSPARVATLGSDLSTGFNQRIQPDD